MIASEYAPTSGLMTVAEACTYLGVTESTLRRWVAAGMPSIKPPGAHRRFRKADLDAYLDALATEQLHRRSL